MSVDSFSYLWEEVVRSAAYYRDVLAAIGALYMSKHILKLTINFCVGTKTYFFGRVWPVPLKELGSWAVISGPTSGIGRAFAIEFAKRGLNVALLGRNPEKLNDVSSFLEHNYNVHTMVVVIDFSDDRVNYLGVQKLFESIDVAVCVNNVGVITEFPSYISEISDHDIKDMINVNVKSITHMTKLAVIHMEEKKRGLIVNISSISAYGPTPLMSVYAATKAFVSSFSQAVHEEVKDSGITVQTLTPSYVRTKMIGYSPFLENSWFVPTPRIYVQNAMCTLGYSTNTPGYWLHGLKLYFLSILPSGVWMYFARKANVHFREVYASLHEE